MESRGVYGYRKLTMDMRDLGERSGKHRVARLLKLEGVRFQTGYGLWLGSRGGKPAVVAPNHLQRRFTVSKPNQSRVADITYRRRDNTASDLAPVEFERRHFQRLKSVWGNRGDSNEPDSNA